MTSPRIPVYHFTADVPVRPGHPQMPAVTLPPYQQPTSPGSYGVYFPVSPQGVNIPEFMPQQHGLRQYAPYPQQQNSTRSQTPPPPPQPLPYIPTSHGHHFRPTTPPLSVSPQGSYPSYRVTGTPPSSSFQNFQAATKYTQNIFTPSMQHQQPNHHQNIVHSHGSSGDSHFTSSQSRHNPNTGMVSSLDFSYGQHSSSVKSSTFDTNLNTRNQSFLGVYSDDQTLLMKGSYNQVKTDISASSAEDMFKAKASKYGIDITTKKDHNQNITEKLTQNAKATEEINKTLSTLNANIFKEKATRYGIEIVNPNEIFDQIESVSKTFNVVEDETIKQNTDYKTDFESSNNSSATLCETFLKEEIGSPPVDSYAVYDVSKEKTTSCENKDLFKYMASQHGITIKSPSPKRSESALLHNEDEDSFKSAAEDLDSNNTSTDGNDDDIMSEDSGILGNQVLFALSKKSRKCTTKTKGETSSNNEAKFVNQNEEDLKSLASIIVSDCITNACNELKKEGYNVEKRRRLYSWEYKTVGRQDSSGTETDEQSEKVSRESENDVDKVSKGPRIITATESDTNINDNRTLKESEETQPETTKCKDRKDLKPSGGLNPAVPAFKPKYGDDSCKFENETKTKSSADITENGDINNIGKDNEQDFDAVSSDKNKFKKLLNPSTPEFKPKGNMGNVVTDSEKFNLNQFVKSGQTLNANVSEFIPGDGGNFMVHNGSEHNAYITVLDPHVLEYQPNSATRVGQSLLMPTGAPVPHMPQPTKIKTIHSSTQTEIVQKVDQSSNTRKVKQLDQQVETVSCDMKEVCVNTVETFDDEEGEFYFPPPVKSDSGMMTEPVSSCDKGIMYKVEQKSKSSLTDENNNIYRLLRSTQRELLQLRYQVCMAEIQRQIDDIEKNKGQWLQIFSSVNERRSLDEIVESKIASLKIETNILQSKLLMYEDQLNEGRVWQQVPTLGLSIPIGPCDIKVVNRQEKYETHINIQTDAYKPQRSLTTANLSAVIIPSSESSIPLSDIPSIPVFERMTSKPLNKSRTSLPVSECRNDYPFSGSLTSLQSLEKRVSMPVESQRQTSIVSTESKTSIPGSESRTSIPVSDNGTSFSFTENRTSLPLSESRESSSVDRKTTDTNGISLDSVIKKPVSGQFNFSNFPSEQKKLTHSDLDLTGVNSDKFSFEPKSTLEITNRHGSIGENPVANRRTLSTEDDKEVASFLITESEQPNLKTMDTDSSSSGSMKFNEKTTTLNNESLVNSSSFTFKTNEKENSRDIVSSSDTDVLNLESKQGMQKDDADLSVDEKSGIHECECIEESANIPVLQFANAVVAEPSNIPVLKFANELASDLDKEIKGLSTQEDKTQVPLSSSSGTQSTSVFDSLNSGVNTTSSDVNFVTNCITSLSTVSSSGISSVSSVTSNSSCTSSTSVLSTSVTSSSTPLVSTGSVSLPVSSSSAVHITGQKLVYGMPQTNPVIGGGVMIPGQVPTIPAHPPVFTPVVPPQFPGAGIPLHSQMPVERPPVPANQLGLSMPVVPAVPTIGAQTPNLQHIPNNGNLNQLPGTSVQNPESSASSAVNLAEMVDLKLFEAVVTQLKQAYPDMAKNPEMLRVVALQQTAVLQCYVAKGHNPLKSKSGIECSSASSKSDTDNNQSIKKTPMAFPSSGAANALGQQDDLQIDEEKPVRLPPGFDKRPDSLPELEDKSPPKSKKEPFKPRNFLDDFTPSKMTSVSNVNTAVCTSTRTFDEHKSSGISMPQVDSSLQNSKQNYDVGFESFKRKRSVSGSSSSSRPTTPQFNDKSNTKNLPPRLQKKMDEALGYRHNSLSSDSSVKENWDDDIDPYDNTNFVLDSRPKKEIDNPAANSSYKQPLLPTPRTGLDNFTDSLMHKPLLPTPVNGLDDFSDTSVRKPLLQTPVGFSQGSSEKLVSGSQKFVGFNDKAVTPPLGECAGDITEIPMPKRKNVITEDKKSEEGSDGESWQQVTKKKRKQDAPTSSQLAKPASQAKKKQNSGTKADAAQKASNFETLVSRISDAFNGLNRVECIQLITDVRNARGGLSGLTLKQILDDAKVIVKTRSTKTTVQRPVNTPSPPSGGLHSATTTSSGFTPPFLRKSYDMSKVGMDFDDDEDICVICHDGLSAFETKSLDCNHVFHSKCIKEWVLKRERTCPTCRRHALFAEEFPKLGK